MASCACVSSSLLLNPFSSDVGRHKRRPLWQSDPSRSFAEKDPAWVICFYFFVTTIDLDLYRPISHFPCLRLSFQPFQCIILSDLFFPPKLLPCEQKVSQNFLISPPFQPLCCLRSNYNRGEASCLTVVRGGGGWWGWVNTFFSGVVFLPHGQRREGDLQGELGDFGAAHPDGRLGNTRVHLVFVLGHCL